VVVLATRLIVVGLFSMALVMVVEKRPIVTGLFSMALVMAVALVLLLVANLVLSFAAA